MKKLYISPVADMIAVEGDTDVLDNDMIAFSIKKGNEGEESSAKGDIVGSAKFMGSAIWDDPEQ